MSERWRLVDTGLRPAAQNIALDRALLEARRADEVPSTLRFLRFPRCALIGCNQSAGQELDVEYCGAGGIDIQRRLTGGDVMCLDPAQLVWELYLHRRDVGTANLQAIARRLCHAAATAVSALGVDARFRPRNDIEVDGRKISDSAGVFDGAALLFQGTLLVDVDPAMMLRASRLSAAAPGSARDRVASLRDLLGARPDGASIKSYLVEAFESEFGVEFSEGDLTLSEHARFQASLREIDHPDWIHLVSRPAAALPVLEARQAVGGGCLHASIAYDSQARTIRQACFGSDISITPRRTLADLESALSGLPAVRLAHRIGRFFAGRSVDMTPLEPADFISVVQLAIGQPLVDRV